LCPVLVDSRLGEWVIVFTFFVLSLAVVIPTVAQWKFIWT